jgi:hypothetical protein
MIERLYKKFNKDGTAFTLLEPAPDLSQISAFAPALTLPGFEKTKYGYMIMPDRQKGEGAIYFSIIRREKALESRN